MYHAACSPCHECPATIHFIGIIAGVLLASLTSPLAHMHILSMYLSAGPKCDSRPGTLFQNHPTFALLIS